MKAPVALLFVVAVAVAAAGVGARPHREVRPEDERWEGEGGEPSQSFEDEAKPSPWYKVNFARQPPPPPALQAVHRVKVRNEECPEGQMMDELNICREVWQ